MPSSIDLINISSDLRRFRAEVKDSAKYQVVLAEILREIRDDVRTLRREMREDLESLRRENQAIVAQTRQLVEGR